MKASSWLRIEILAVVVVVCLFQKSTTVLAASIPPATAKPHATEGSKPKEQAVESGTVIDGERTESPAPVIPDKRGIGDGQTELKPGDNLAEELNMFNPFLGFPFFPFPFPNLKRDVFGLNSSEKTIRTDGDGKPIANRTDPKPKPFFFIDFAFNIQEVPLNNATPGKEASLKGSDKKSPQSEPTWVSKKESGRQKMPFDGPDDDWPFGRDSPLMPPDLDGFLSKPDFLFFDFPFGKKQSRQFSRNKRDMPEKPRAKSDIHFIMDFLDEAIARTKTELERTAPLVNLMRDDAPVAFAPEEEGKGAFPGKRESGRVNALPHFDDDKRWKGAKSPSAEKRSPSDSARHKNPVIFGKMMEIGEIHFGDNYPKNRRHRRTSSSPDRKGKHSNRDAFEVIQVNSPMSSSDWAPKPEPPMHLHLKDLFKKIHKRNLRENESASDADRKKGNDMAITSERMDRPRSENLPQGKAIFIRSQEGNRQMTGVGSPGNPKVIPSHSEGFKYVGHMPTVRDPNKDSFGFELLGSESSYRRAGRKDSEDAAAPENTTREELKKNISQALTKFFSRIKKFGDGQNLDQVKDVPDMDEFSWMELEDLHETGSLIKDAMERRRRGDDHEVEQRPHLVADLNFLFLTVTLPTLFAFTLLLAVCFFNLRLRGWLCKRLFKPRNVYVVEADTEKADGHTVKATRQQVKQDKSRESERDRGEKDKRDDADVPLEINS